MTIFYDGGFGGCYVTVLTIVVGSEWETDGFNVNSFKKR